MLLPSSRALNSPVLNISRLGKRYPAKNHPVGRSGCHRSFWYKERASVAVGAQPFKEGSFKGRSLFLFLIWQGREECG